MKPMTQAETEALLESTRDALDDCLDTIAHLRALSPHNCTSESEYAMHGGQDALDSINEVLRPIYAPVQP